jgi:hypothetical protein
MDSQQNWRGANNYYSTYVLIMNCEFSLRTWLSQSRIQQQEFTAETAKNVEKNKKISALKEWARATLISLQR